MEARLISPPSYSICWFRTNSYISWFWNVLYVVPLQAFRLVQTFFRLRTEWLWVIIVSVNSKRNYITSVLISTCIISSCNVTLRSVHYMYWVWTYPIVIAGDENLVGSCSVAHPIQCASLGANAVMSHCVSGSYNIHHTARILRHSALRITNRLTPLCYAKVSVAFHKLMTNADVVPCAIHVINKSRSWRERC